MKECIREAQVIDNVDSDQLGKIKVRIFPEMVEIPVDLLPWATAYQFTGMGTSSGYGTHAIPEIDSYIRVLIEDYPLLKRIRYISDDYVEGLYVYSAFENAEIDELGTQTYPQPFFKCYKDGTIDFHNSETGEHGTFFKGGGYQLVDASGNFYANSKTKEIKIYNNNAHIHIKASGDVEISGLNIKATGGTFEVGGSVAPTGQGALCGLPYCLYTGAPQTGPKSIGT